MHRLSMLLLVTLGGLASAAGLATFDIAVAATAPDLSTGSRRDHATLHCDDGRPDIIPEHRIVRDPLTCNFYQLSPEEFRHFEPPAPRPEATTPDDLLPKNDNGRTYSSNVYSAEHRIVRDPVTGDFWQLSPEEFRYFERPEPRPEPTLPGIQPEPDEPERLALGPLTLEGNQLSVDSARQSAERDEQDRLEANRIFREDFREIAENPDAFAMAKGLVASLNDDPQWQSRTRAEIAREVGSRIRKLAGKPGDPLAARRDQKRNLPNAGTAAGRQPAEDAVLANIWRAGATNGLPPGQGESVDPIESRRGSGTIGGSRIGAGAASTLSMALIATILGYGVSRLFFRRRITSGVVLSALLTCWVLATSLHVLLGDRFFSENVLNVVALMAAIVAAVIGLLTPNSAGKEKTVPPMQIAASPRNAQQKAGETTRPSLSSGGDDEDAMYEKAWAEITAASPKAAVWARAYAESDGDDSKTRAAYIRLRVSELNSNRSSD